MQLSSKAQPSSINPETMEDRSEKKPKTVLFVCIATVSHSNSVLGLANHLRKQGHRTCFLFNKPFAGNIRKRYGHEVYDCLTPDLTESADDEASVKSHAVSDLIQETNRDHWTSGNQLEAVESIYEQFVPRMLADYTPECDKNLTRKMELLKPDLMVIDHFFMYPALYKLKIPWLRIFSPAPLSLHCSEELPQPFLGLATNWDKNDPLHVEWNAKAKASRRKFYDTIMNPYWTSHGLPDLPRDPVEFFPHTELGTRMYMCAKELDYEQPLVGWERFDFSARDYAINKFEIPEKIRDKPGKLIFLSMGSLASADAALMKRLTSMLADCPHRFIVATGSSGHEYGLPDNMWGDKFLPQLDILQLIDLIITHGGNNTVTESLYFGVPAMIVCPLFGDQHDNAQRVQETGLGLRLDPSNCTKAELQGAIEELLNRPGLRQRMRAISERMQSPEARDKPLRLVDEFVRKHS